MELTVKQMIQAHAALVELKRREMTYAMARQVRQWSTACRKELQGVFEHEQLLMERYGGSRKENKEITFPTPEQASEFYEERERMLQTAVYVDLEKIDMSGLQKKLFLKAEYFELLEPICNFEGV